MKDRVPLYPGRVKLTPVSGQENTYDMVRADEPTQEGTPLSKATFLKDDTAALFGLDATAVPDDALALLSRFQSGLGNEYVWEKRDSTSVVGYVNSPDHNAYPPAVSDGYTYTPLGQIGAGLLRMDLLWENASPFSAFPAQTISIDLSKYYFVFTNYWDRPTSESTWMYSSMIMLKGKTSYQGSSMTNVYRLVTVNDDSIVFGALENAGGLPYGVPRYIYGIRGVNV